MSMYACNNICKAVNQYSRNGIYVGGIIVNARNNDIDKEIIKAFVDKIGLEIFAFVPRSNQIACAEYKAQPLHQYNPEAEVIQVFDEMVEKMQTITK